MLVTEIGEGAGAGAGVGVVEFCWGAAAEDPPPPPPHELITKINKLKNNLPGLKSFLRITSYSTG